MGDTKFDFYETLLRKIAWFLWEKYSLEQLLIYNWFFWHKIWIFFELFFINCLISNMKNEKNLELKINKKIEYIYFYQIYNFFI